MNDDPHQHRLILQQLQRLAESETIRLTQHAQQEMVEEDITLDDVLQAIQSSQIIENYPDHRRGACCLLAGFAANQRPIHVVCTTSQPLLIIITVYEPQQPKWLTPYQRNR